MRPAIDFRLRFPSSRTFYFFQHSLQQILTLYSLSRLRWSYSLRIGWPSQPFYFATYLYWSVPLSTSISSVPSITASWHLLPPIGWGLSLILCSSSLYHPPKRSSTCDELKKSSRHLNAWLLSMNQSISSFTYAFLSSSSPRYSFSLLHRARMFDSAFIQASSLTTLITSLVLDGLWFTPTLKAKWSPKEAMVGMNIKKQKGIIQK